MQVVHGSLIGIGNVRAAGLARNQNGKVIMPMLVAVAQSAAVDDERMIEQRAVAIRRGLQFRQEIRELLDMEGVDAPTFSIRSGSPR